MSPTAPYRLSLAWHSRNDTDPAVIWLREQIIGLKGGVGSQQHCNRYVDWKRSEQCHAWAGRRQCSDT
ncbi:protein of unknown function [Burkholderia multivorans]